MSEFVTTRKAAEMLGITIPQIHALLRSNRINGHKLGHDWIVFQPSIQTYLATKSRRGRPTSWTPTLRVKK